MTVAYQKILAEGSLRINALVGTSASGLETAYITSPLTTTQFQSTIFSFTALKDAVITAEEKLATAIADTGDHPYRAYLMSETATLLTGADMPSTDASGVPIIGIYGAVLDAVDESFVCTEQPTEVIRRWKALSTYYKSDFYYYAMDGNGITHTRPDGVVVQVCVYSASVARAAITANGNIILPDALEEAYIWGMLSTLMRDDEFTAQAQMYRGLFNDTLQAIRGGLTSIPSVAMSGPTQIPAVST